MNTILALDTTTNILSVALGKDGKVIKALESEGKYLHSSNLVPLIDDLFCQTGIKLKDVDLFATTIGPGSFTGIRIGAQTAKAFAYSLGKKCFAVSCLDILAASLGVTDKKIVSLIDARNDNVFWASFLYDEEFGVKQISEYKFDKKEDVIKQVGEDVVFTEENKCDGSGIIKFAYKNINQEKYLCDAFDLKPIYLKSVV